MRMALEENQSACGSCQVVVRSMTDAEWAVSWQITPALILNDFVVDLVY